MVASGLGPSTVMPGQRPALLFTAFEPSGDDHASVVIAELRRRHPYLPIYAWGGPKMAQAGATIIERTTDDAVMGVPGVRKIIDHVRINRRIEEWLDRTRISVHIPVDSPDGNFPIAKLAKERGVRVVHLVAPQLWAWREGRIKKLKRLTDLVLCVLPFEEQWFLRRGVPARFVGHPLFDAQLDTEALDRLVHTWPTGQPKIALMPGSRPGEIDKCFPLLLDAWVRIKKNFPGAAAVVPLTHERVHDRLRRLANEFAAQQPGQAPGARPQADAWPDDVHAVAGNTDAVIRWCDFALVASGTVTLQVAKQCKPMITFYRAGKAMRVPYAVFGPMLFKTRYFTLPNLIADAPVVPELVPHFGDGFQLAVGAYRLLRQPGFADRQREALRQVAAKFSAVRCGPAAADAIEQIAGLR
jgi:lipid-A-disaccharide synthase